MLQFLQTSSAPTPVLEVGDRVLVTVAESGAGYVLGRIGPPSRVTASSSRTAETVQVVAPDGVEAVRIAGRRVTVAAEDELVLECAGGSVRIDGNGKVVVLGTDVTTRARRLHKIKGGARRHQLVETVNPTPFAADLVGLSDLDGAPYLVAVLKATYALGDSGEMAPADAQRRGRPGR